MRTMPTTAATNPVPDHYIQSSLPMSYDIHNKSMSYTHCFVLDGKVRGGMIESAIYLRTRCGFDHAESYDYLRLLHQEWKRTSQAA